MSRQRRDRRFTHPQQEATEGRRVTESGTSGLSESTSTGPGGPVNRSAPASPSSRLASGCGLSPRSKDEHRRAAAAEARVGVGARPRKPRSCGKVRYPDRIAAALAMARIRAVGEPRGKDVRRAYQCPHCGGWHLTSRAVWSPRH